MKYIPYSLQEFEIIINEFLSHLAHFQPPSSIYLSVIIGLIVQYVFMIDWKL